MADAQFSDNGSSQVNPITPIGNTGMVSPKAEFYNHYLREFGDYFSLCCYADAENNDYRIHNGCMSLIGLIDSLDIQHQMMDEYRTIMETLTKQYCTYSQVSERDLTEEELLMINRESAHRIVGKVSLWVGRHFMMRRPYMIGVCRGPPGYEGDADHKIKLNPMPDQYGKEFNIAEYYAKIITGKIVQDVSQITVGFRGAGKSIKDLSLCEKVAAWVSYYVDGDPSLRGSRNYFNQDMIACVSAERAAELMAEPGKYLQKMFDDITARGWNSRNYASKDNKNHNALFMVNRTAQCGQYFSFPDLFTFDKVPRSMSSHFCEMLKGTAGMREHTEHNMGRLFEIDKEFRQDNPLYRYMIYDNNIVQYIVYPKCTNEMMEWYKEIRVKAAEDEQRQKEKEEEEESKPKVSKARQRMMNQFKDYEDFRLKGCSHEEALREVGWSKKTFSYAKQCGVAYDI